MYKILKATQRLFEAEKTFEEIFKPFSNEEIKGFRSEKIRNFLEKVKHKIKDNGDGTVDVEGDFDCQSLGLESLEEFGLKIRHVSGYFYCSNNSLTSLKGAPESVDEGFYCYYNVLTSLNGAPKSVGGSFSCSNNSLSSLEFSPKSVGRYFYCYSNAKKFTEEEVKAVCNVTKGIRV